MQLFIICWVWLILLFSNSNGYFAKRSESIAFDNISEKNIKIGKSYYIKYSCISCHGKNGKMLGDLTQAYKKYNDMELIKYIKRPDKYNNLKMPQFESVIPEACYPQLIMYIKYLGKTAR